MPINNRHFDEPEAIETLVSFFRRDFLALREHYLLLAPPSLRERVRSALVAVAPYRPTEGEKRTTGREDE